MHILTQTLLKTLQDAQDYTDLKPPRPLHALSDLHNWHEILHLYDALEDAASKEIFTKLIMQRILYFTVSNDIIEDKFSLYPKAVWQELIQAAENLPGVQGDYILDRLETWILKGYECKECKAQPGDIVIDAGAYTGNTVVYFANRVGHKGRVLAFEPMKEAFIQLQKNTAHLAQVELFQAGVSHSDGQVFVAEQNTPGASLHTQGDIQIQTRSLDSFVQEHSLPRLDFLKMDIEGSEMDALDGARNTIANFTPKLAVCIYHRPIDIFQIFKRILEINAHYTFHLKHCSNTVWETVLFCMPSTTAHTSIDYATLYADDISVAHVLRNIYKNIYDITEV